MIAQLFRRLAGSVSLGVLLAVGLLAPASRVAAQTIIPCLEVLDSITRQPVTVLCVGRTYELHKCGPPPPPNTPIYYDTTRQNTSFSYPGTNTIIRFRHPGRRLIRQLINIGGTGGPDTATYDIYPTAQPQVLLEPCLRSVRVTILDSAYSFYTVSFDGQPPVTTRAVVGDQFTSPVSPGTGPVAVWVLITGRTEVPGRPPSPCVTTPYDQTLILPDLPPPPRIKLLDVRAPTAAHTVLLRLAGLRRSARYVVERATPTGNFLPLPDTLRPTTDTLSVTLTGAPTATAHRYRVRLLREASCDVNLADNLLTSNEAGALPLVATPAASGPGVDVRWPDYPAAGTVLRWRVRRDGREVTTLGPTARTYSDAGVVGCPRDLCYEVVAVVQPPGAALADTLLAISGDSCAHTRGNVPDAPLLTASFDLSNNLILRAKRVPAGVATSFEFSETVGAALPAVLGASPQPGFTVVAPDTARVRETCYSVVLTDTCVQRSALSGAACPTVLRGRRSPNGLTAVMSWTAYRGFPATATYSVELLDEQTNAIIRSSPPRPATFAYTDLIPVPAPQVLRYRVRVEVPGDTARVVFSNLLNLSEEELVRLPNAFTPNGDNLNDTFGPVGRYELREQELTIYDRWGRELFRTTTPGQSWDGRPPGGGEVVPPGVFAYRFRGRDAAGHEFTQKGTVTVLR